jgi:hypothetical protein
MDMLEIMGKALMEVSPDRTGTRFLPYLGGKALRFLFFIILSFSDSLSISWSWSWHRSAASWWAVSLHTRVSSFQDEPVILTHDEHEFLAGPNGDRIIDAVQNRNLAAVSAALCKEMALYGQIHDDLNIHERPSDKLYDIFKTQVSARPWRWWNSYVKRSLLSDPIAYHEIVYRSQTRKDGFTSFTSGIRINKKRSHRSNGLRNNVLGKPW